MKTLRCENLDDLKFQPGDDAWTITPKGDVRAVTIRWINARLLKDKNGLVTYLTTYEGSIDNPFHGMFNCTFHQYELR